MIFAYFFRVLVAGDRFLNALLGGKAYETLSQRMGRNVAEGRCWLCRPVCWLLDKVDPNHCADAANKVRNG